MADTRVDLHGNIRGALRAIGDDNFAEQASRLLGVLGYRSERTLPGQSGAVDEFLSRFPAENPGTKSEQEFGDAISSVRVLFQVADQEVEEAGGSLLLFRDNAFDKGNARSFIFTAVQLRGDGYPRGRYAAYTREINKRFPRIPAVVLFRTAAGRITLAFVHVRPNKRNPERNVLGSVSLIREVKTDDPHRAHVDILAELALEERLQWMRFQRRPINFDGLLAAWLDALDTEELNRRFYRALKDWFDRAVDEARFPKTGPRVLQSEEHVIRLITRLLFVWFVKEKGLVADELFIEAQVRGLLKDYDADDGDSYYRAVLQNLFFATLNTEIGRRGFSSGVNPTHRDFSRYRYRAEMSDADALRAYFDKTPFINGGLFDCLDSESAASQGGYRIDYFSDNAIVRGTAEHGKLSIPNRLFFDNDGLITLFNHYKFTVEENTPAEQEVALDPELLGKVFENLLAAYNPETKDSARKQTGSYYTPRAVVDYMVDEALLASLAQKAQPADGDNGFWQERLRYLLDYNDAFEDAASLFVESEAEQVIGAIARLRVLDPAVGSGAFPMGVLHKLTLALRRLDPDNRRWEALQKTHAVAMAADAFDSGTRRDRDKALDEISETFERYRDSDFGRKLYLIQNSIYGVDIQPVATQIAKLRFFISLAIEQQPHGDPNANYGIKPLPNLETRFVAANTLLGLAKATQIPLGGRNRVTELNDQLRRNRELHFHAGARQEKLRLRKEDARLRSLLAKELAKAGMSASDANNVSRWDPYDQNAHADWFDAGYMFDITAGFDVVIGNPPYAQLQKEGGRLGNLYQSANYTTFARTGDIYQLFYEQGFRLLTPGGLLSYITSNSWLKAEYGKPTRRHIGDSHTVLRLLEMGKNVFENVIVDAAVLVARAGKTGESGVAVDTDRLTDKTFPPAEPLWSAFRPQKEGPWSVLSSTEQSIGNKLEAVGTPLRDWNVRINRGVTTGYNDAFIIDTPTRDMLVAADPKSAEIIKPVLRGRDISRYRAQWAGMWLITTFPSLQLNVDDYPSVKRHLLSFGKDQLEQSGKTLPDSRKSRKKTGNAWFEVQDATAYHEEFLKEKLFWIDLTERGRFALDEGTMFCANTAYVLSGQSIRYLCAVLNSQLMTWYIKNTALNSGMGVPRWVRFTVERLPIPKLSADRQRPFIRLVDHILAAKRAKASADTSTLEAEVDRLVSALYGLTEEEVAVVEGR